MTSQYEAPVCPWCGIFQDRDGKGHCNDKGCARHAEIHAAAIAKERADLRSWLGQQAAKANRDAKKAAVTSRLLGMTAAFKEAADHLKPAKVKGHLKRKRAARAVGKEVSK